MKKISKIFLIFLAIIIIALVSVFIYVRAAYQTFYTEGQSMEPNVANGDYLLMKKNNNNYSRGDIIIFYPPISSGSIQVYFKRIIGLPGEKVSFSGGTVLINGKVLEENYLCANAGNCDENTISDNKSEYDLSSNEYFVMGDNRSESSDSRIFGPIKKESIIGTAKYLLEFAPWKAIDIGNLSFEIPRIKLFNKIKDPTYIFGDAILAAQSDSQSDNDNIGLLPAPKNFRIIDQSNNTFTMQWDNIAGIEDYELYRSYYSDHSFANVDFVRYQGTSVLFDNDSLYPGTTYYYKLRYKDASGKYSDFSDTISGTIPQANEPQPNAQSEADNLIAKVGQLIELPSGETPSVATVTDQEILKDQPFFKNAENGDKVLIYTNAQKAILYRPSTNKVIEVMPITF